MPNFNLVADRVAVKLDDPESMSKGGIVLPDNAKKKSVEGTVIAIGPGKWSETAWKRIPMSIKVGYRVLVEQYGQQKIEVDGEEYTTLREEDVIAILAS
jgi:chaperonin GroES